MYKFIFPLIFLSLFCPALFAEEEKDDPCFSQTSESELVDQAYNYLNRKFCQPALWFDEFFVDDRFTEDARAGTMVRWYNDFKLVESEGFEYDTQLKARFHLPKGSRKLKVVFESDAEDHLTNLFPNNSETANSTLGLRYDWYAKGRSSFNVKVSLRPSIEARYRYSYPFTEQTVGNFTQRVYQKKKVTGEVTELDVEHSFNPIFLLRWSNYFKYENDVEHFELGSGLTLYQYISRKQALSYKASMTAHDKPHHFISNSHLSVTYRHNILRKWFFYEFTPEINWPKEHDSNREKEAAVTLRLEVFFENI
ncbi:hypothetical protein [Psychromonas ossibalaenae]|uniref:hypothetical protein n=1 Tax=Psychromonas ossibalaenae TaxID=444922 RepID=UPI00035D2238|nr:hypothetical protein [Psychromonas ossibalaenae]